VAKGVAYAVTKHRFRMAIVYRYAQARNLMVVGAANRTEWLTGTFTKWGVDHCADVMPLIHLYRSQLERIAKAIDVPAAIRDKSADPDLLPGVNDKGALLGGFHTADQILYGIEQGVDEDALIHAYGRKPVEQILNLWQLSMHMRESPYQIQASV
jgi:NAD+ synthase